MKILCLCTCCGGSEDIEYSDFEERGVDKSDYTIAMCTSCIESSRIDIKATETEPKVIAEFRHIEKNGYAIIKYEGKSIVVDMFSASAVIKVWDNISEKNRADWMERTKGNPSMLADMAFRLINSINKKARAA